MALPPREDGRAHDRRQDGHGRVVRRGVPAHDAVPADVPGPLGRPVAAVSGAEPAAPGPLAPDLRRSPNPLARRLRAVRASASGCCSPGTRTRRGPTSRSRAWSRRSTTPRATSTRSGSARSRRPTRCAPPSARCSATRARRVALGQNTHELVLRFLSALDLARAAAARHDRRRVPHAAPPARAAGGGRARRRARRGGAVRTRSPSASRPSVDDRTAAVLVSAVLFETARIVPGLDALAGACAAPRGRAARRRLPRASGRGGSRSRGLGLREAWVVGGGYKYLQLGEGNCFLRLPAAGRRTCARRSRGGTRSSTRSPPSTGPATRSPTARGRLALRRLDLRPDEPLPRRPRSFASSPSAA